MKKTIEQTLKDVPTKTISKAMRKIAGDIMCDDGVTNAACIQAADRLDELEEELTHLRWNIAKIIDKYGGLLK
jgi:hypothetical protein